MGELEEIPICALKIIVIMKNTVVVILTGRDASGLNVFKPQI